MPPSGRGGGVGRAGIWLRGGAAVATLLGRTSCLRALKKPKVLVLDGGHTRQTRNALRAVHVKEATNENDNGLGRGVWEGTLVCFVC